MDYNYSYDFSPAAAGALIAYYIVMLIVAVIVLIAYWKIFTKAGEPGWAAIVPLYNTYTMFKIACGNGWLFLLMFVPVVNVVFSFIMLYKLCAAFGKGVGFFIGMIFLAPIFILILAFGDAEYYGPQ